MKTELALTAMLVFASISGAPIAKADLPIGAENARPLQAGSRVPDVTVKTAEGLDYDLVSNILNKPTVIIFYRGGWCPYCNLHLGQLQEAEPALLALGYQILAISTDRPGDLHLTTDRHHLTYTLLSDRGMAASSAFHVAYKLSPRDRANYLKHGIRVPPIPNDPEGRWLPIPSAFVVNRRGEIKFVYSNPDIKIRISMPDLLAAAKSAAQ